MTSADTLQDLTSVIASIKASSTLDKSTAKKNLIDNSPETCWTSQQGLPQYLLLSFSEPVVPTSMSLIFQGGFVGTRCAVQVPLPRHDPSAKRDWQLAIHVYPEDVNRKQTFELKCDLFQPGVDMLKLVFEESSDFFGRITIYDLKLQGTKAKA